jgi:hypothetical protein
VRQPCKPERPQLPYKDRPLPPSKRFDELRRFQAELDAIAEQDRNRSQGRDYGDRIEI